MVELKILKMSQIQTEPVSWLWKPYIPFGAITLIQGDGGEGKTTMALAIATAVSRGETLPDSMRSGGNVAPFHVVVQNAEDSYSQTIKPRLEQLGADLDMIHVIDEEEKALTFSDERLEQAIIRTGAKLVILDPIQAYFGKSNMNSADSVRPLMKHLANVAEKHQCAVLLVGHLHKKGGKAAYRGLGSIDIYSAARSVLSVGSVDDDIQIRAVIHNKSNLSQAGKSLAFEINPTFGFSWLGEYDIRIEELFGRKKEEKPENKLSIAKWFLESALKNGSVTAVNIYRMAEEKGISEKTLNRAKSVLGVTSTRRGDEWFWDLPIDIVYTQHENNQEPT